MVKVTPQKSYTRNHSVKSYTGVCLRQARIFFQFTKLSNLSRREVTKTGNIFILIILGGRMLVYVLPSATVFMLLSYIIDNFINTRYLFSGLVIQGLDLQAKEIICYICEKKILTSSIWLEQTLKRQI